MYADADLDERIQAFLSLSAAYLSGKLHPALLERREIAARPVQSMTPAWMTGEEARSAGADIRKQTTV